MESDHIWSYSVWGKVCIIVNGMIYFVLIFCWLIKSKASLKWMWINWSNHYNVFVSFIFLVSVHNRNLITILYKVKISSSGAVNVERHSFWEIQAWQDHRENDFTLWRIKMKALMVHQGISMAINKRELEVVTDKWKILWVQAKAHSALILSLGEKVLREVSEKNTALGIWEKLQTLYMK